MGQFPFENGFTCDAVSGSVEATNKYKANTPSHQPQLGTQSHAGDGGGGGGGGDNANNKNGGGGGGGGGGGDYDDNIDNEHEDD